MKILVLKLTVATVFALACPTFALDIPQPTPQAPIPSLEMPAPEANWTAEMQDSVSAALADSAPVLAEQPIEPMAPQFEDLNISEASYVKSTEDMQVLNTTITYGPFGSDVPEPGALAGMSAGLAGLFYGFRRSRQRS